MFDGRYVVRWGDFGVYFYDSKERRSLPLKEIWERLNKEVKNMPTDGQIISLLSHTLGSIGQIVKDASTLQGKYTVEEGYKEIKRIYDGYIKAIIKLNE